MASKGTCAESAKCEAYMMGESDIEAAQLSYACMGQSMIIESTHIFKYSTYKNH